MGKEGNFLPSQKEMFSQAETERMDPMLIKKWIAAASAAVLTTVGAAQPLSGVVSADTESTGTSANSSYNYGEALQKSDRKSTRLNSSHSTSSRMPSSA